VIQEVYEQLLARVTHFEEEALPLVRAGNLAHTSTHPADGAIGRVQVARQQPDGTWLRTIDRPERPQDVR